jgi:hypothetical protein
LAGGVRIIELDASICRSRFQQSDSLGMSAAVPRLGDRFSLQRERRHLNDALTGDPQRLTARGKEADPGRLLQDDVGEHGDGVEEVFTVVEDEQRFA